MISSKEPVLLTVVGAGLVGRQHIKAISQCADQVRLQAIVDPDPEARSYVQTQAGWLSAAQDVRFYSALEDMLADAAQFPEHRPDGIILATPSQLHLDHGYACVEAGIPFLMEKPFTTDSQTGIALLEATQQAGLTCLVGHHRRHNPLIRRAREVIESGSLGTIVSCQATGWLYKPEEYFEPEWRRRPGGGPVYINLIHDIDLLQALMGPIDQVYALESNRIRGHQVEDTVVLTLQFTSGAIGTVNISDTIVAPWSWELTARENPAYAPTSQAAYLIGGTHGSLELPGLRLWRQSSKRSWWEPMESCQLTQSFGESMIQQIRQFAAVIRKEEPPLCSGQDGLQALRVIEAIKQSAAEGKLVQVTSP